MPRWYVIPAGTKPSQCSGSTCRALVYWIHEPGGRAVPVDIDVQGGEAPSDTSDASQLDAFRGSATVFEGRGVHHMTECPDKEEILGRRQQVTR